MCSLSLKLWSSKLQTRKWNSKVIFEFSSIWPSKFKEVFSINISLCLNNFKSLVPGPAPEWFGRCTGDRTQNITVQPVETILYQYSPDDTNLYHTKKFFNDWGNVKFSISINLVSKVFQWLLTLLKFCLCYIVLHTMNKNVTVSKTKFD